MQTIYLIKKISVTDGLIETGVELYTTEEARDQAFEVLIHDHNNMIQDAYDVDLSKPESYEDSFYYEWSSDYLEFYDKAEPDCHHDIYEKDWEVLHEEA